MKQKYVEARLLYDRLELMQHYKPRRKFRKIWNEHLHNLNDLIEKKLKSA